MPIKAAPNPSLSTTNPSNNPKTIPLQNYSTAQIVDEATRNSNHKQKTTTTPKTSHRTMTLLRRGTRFSWPLIILLTLLSGEILNVQAQENKPESQAKRWVLPDFGTEGPKGEVKLPNSKIFPINELEAYSKGEIEGACSVSTSGNKDM